MGILNNNDNRTGSSSLGVTADGPATLACWARRTTGTTDDFLLAVEDSVNSEWYSIGHEGTDDAQCVVRRGNHDFGSSGTVNNTGWNHYCGTFTAADDTSAFVNGGGKVTSSVTRTLTVPDSFRIGGRRNGTTSDLEGDIAEAAIWDVILTDAEIASLGAGVSPMLIRPANLVYYNPLITYVDTGTIDTNLFGVGTDAGNSGHAATTTEPLHPPIFRPTSPEVGQFQDVGSVINVSNADYVIQTSQASITLPKTVSALNSDIAVDTPQASIIVSSAQTVDAIQKNWVWQPNAAAVKQNRDVNQTPSDYVVQAESASISSVSGVTINVSTADYVCIGRQAVVDTGAVIVTDPIDNGAGTLLLNTTIDEWAWFNEQGPANFDAPNRTGTNATTNGAGELTLNVGSAGAGTIVIKNGTHFAIQEYTAS